MGSAVAPTFRYKAVISFRGFLSMLLVCVAVRRGRVHGLISRLHLSRHRTSICDSRLQSTFTDQTQPTVELPSAFNSWLDLELPEGRCIGVEMVDLDDFDQELITPQNIKDDNHWIHSTFHPEEVAYGIQLKPASRSSFWMGRLAMRIALGFPEYAILKDSYGRPQLSSGKCGSISHKENKGVALVSSNDSGALGGVGIDLELTKRPGKRSIARRVLTETEQQNLGNLPHITAEEEVLLRFSLKEAIYKAAHPLLCQYVSFQEAEVTPHEDGTATCDWYLASRAHERIGQLTAHWRILESEGYFLTSASVEPR